MRAVLINQIDLEQFALERQDDKRVIFVHQGPTTWWKASDCSGRYWSRADLAIGAAYLRLADPLGRAGEEMQDAPLP